MNYSSLGTNPVVLILSCDADRKNGRNATVRLTWLGKWGALIPYRFVYGALGGHQGQDEIFVDCPDGYAALSQKQHGAYAWAMHKGYSHVFICCTDTYVHVPHLLVSDFTRGDYIGRRCDGEIYASGGAGYWLSANAIRTMHAQQGPVELPGCNGWPDAIDGHLLAKFGVPLIHDPRYWGHRPDPLPADFFETFVSVHLSKGTGVYDPTWMHEVHELVQK